MPRGGGKGGTLLRARRFKLRHTRKVHFYFTMNLLREKEPGVFYKKIAYYNRLDNVYFQN